MVSGKVPQEVSRFMAGGSLTALSKLKPGCAPDIRPIAVGEVLRRLTGKCLCAVIKHRVIDFFEPIMARNCMPSLLIPDALLRFSRFITVHASIEMY